MPPTAPVIDIEVEVDTAAWTQSLPGAAAAAREAALAAARLAGSGTIAILLTDDATVRDLNARFLCKDAATNVLAFPAGPNPGNHLGDIALAFGVCAREAAEQAKPLADHLRHLVIHGVLHLMGYDHQSEDQAEAMERLERDLLAALGVPDPYAEGDHAQPRR
ncbi:MAG: rRNA maturation RNase YbeY [Pseudomonadota bacterium]|nr:rRNA maturation RNase YbeY [Pseudomonadota bacterium]